MILQQISNCVFILDRVDVMEKINKLTSEKKGMDSERETAEKRLASKVTLHTYFNHLRRYGS